MQKFIPVIEKYCDLHIGGHQHNFSATKPLRTGYNGTDPYNFYYDNNQSPKLQAALADESSINKKGPTDYPNRQGLLRRFMISTR